jgi:hypothetical protein
MTQFESFFQLGMAHITDVQGYDHILYVSSLCLGLTWRHARTLLWLVTAFTAGHSLTLALAAPDLVRVNAALIELLIPITILLSVLLAVWREFFLGRLPPWGRHRVFQGFAALRARAPEVAHAPAPEGAALTPPGAGVGLWVYGLTVVFGLVHGMGFSNYLRALLAGSDGFVGALFAFNIGLEAGQLIILALVMGVFSLLHLIGIPRRWVFVLAALAIAVPAGMLVWERV